MHLERLWIVAASLLCFATGATQSAAQPALDKTTTDGVDPSQWRRIALDRALIAAGEVDDPYRRAEAFAGIARAQVLVEDTSAADRTIHQALAAAQQVAEPDFRGWVLHEVVLAQIAADDMLGARETAARIEAPRPQGAALAVVADIQLRSGDLAAAQATAGKIREAGAKGEVLRQIVATQSARGDLAAARESLRAIDDPFYLTGATGDIAVAEVRRGNVTQAKALAARVRRSGRSDVYGRIALAQVERSDVSGATETLQKIDDELHRAVIQGRIAVSRAMNGDTANAQQLFASAFATVEGVKIKSQRQVMALAQLARLQAAVGESAAAKQTLKRARVMASRLDAGMQREDALDYIARGQARMGDTPEALETALEMNDRVACALLVRDVVTSQSDVTSATASVSAANFADPLIETAAQFGVLGVQLLKSGQLVSAGTIDAAREAVRRIDDMQLKPAAFSALAAARVKTGDAQASQAIFDESIAAAESIVRNDQRAAAYVRVVNALNDRLIFLGKPAEAGTEKVEPPL